MPQQIKESGRRDNLNTAIGSHGKQMLFISRHQEVGLSRNGALQDPIVIFLGCNHRYLFVWCDQPGHHPNGVDRIIGFSLRETEFVSQNPAELGKDERGENQLDFSLSYTIKNLVWLAAWENKGGDQDIGVQNDFHRRAGYFRAS